jgi:hypothetical protein
MSAPRRLLLVTQWTDFDAGAEAAAIALAARLGVPLGVVVPLVSNPEYEVVAPRLVAEAEEATARSIAAFTDRARTAGVAIDIRVRRGEEPWREVVEEARVSQADLIVTRRRGKRGFLSKLRVGEMVQQVALYAHCPVMMVPRAAQAPARGVLTVIDAASAIEPEMRSATSLAGALGLALGVVVVVPQGAAQQQGDALLRRAQAAVRSPETTISGSIRCGRLADVVAESLRAMPADLLVVGIAPGGAGHGKLGTTAETVVGEADCATLLVGERAQGAG